MELERIRMHFDTAYQALTSSDEAGSSKAAASASPLSRVLKGLVRGHGPMTVPTVPRDGHQSSSQSFMCVAETYLWWHLSSSTADHAAQ